MRFWLVIAISVLVIASPQLVAQRPGRRGAPSPQARGGPGNAGGGLLKHEVKDASRKQAVCNDGSPAAFYFRPGKDSDRDKWIIFLQGGGACGTDSDCRKRWTDAHNFMSSVGLPDRSQEGGLLSSDERENPDFARYALVEFHYCSSDAYTGDGQRKLDGRTLQFRGRRIVDAVLDDLMDSSVVGPRTLREATEVMFAGSSAGAMGMHNNLDRVAARLSWARVKGVADSGWNPTVEPFGRGTLEVRPDGPALVEYSNAQPDESCVAANPKQKGRCLQENFLYPYLSTPMFVYADQRDPVHLGTLGIMGPVRSQAERGYVDDYGRRLRDELKNVAGVFSPSTNMHTSLRTDLFHSVTIDGQDLATTIGNWYFDRRGPKHLIAPATAADGRTRGAPAVGSRVGRGGPGN